MRANNQSAHRNRRTIFEQLSTMKHTTGRLIKGKGKHGLIKSRHCDGQWGMMPGHLKENFKAFDAQLEELMATYQAWLLQVGVHDPMDQKTSYLKR